MSEADSGHPQDELASEFRPTRSHPRHGVIVGGSLVSGGTLAYAIVAIAKKHCPGGWVETLDQLAPILTSLISGVVYTAGQIISKYVSHRNWNRDRNGAIKYFESKIKALSRSKSRHQKGQSPGKADLIKTIEIAIRSLEARQVLAEVSEFPERPWELPPPRVLESEQGLAR